MWSEATVRLPEWRKGLVMSKNIFFRVVLWNRTNSVQEAYVEASSAEEARDMAGFVEAPFHITVEEGSPPSSPFRERGRWYYLEGGGDGPLLEGNEDLKVFEVEDPILGLIYVVAHSRHGAMEKAVGSCPQRSTATEIEYTEGIFKRRWQWVHPVTGATRWVPIGKEFPGETDEEREGKGNVTLVEALIRELFYVKAREGFDLNYIGKGEGVHKEALREKLKSIAAYPQWITFVIGAQYPRPLLNSHGEVFYRIREKERSFIVVFLFKKEKYWAELAKINYGYHSM